MEDDDDWFDKDIDEIVQEVQKKKPVVPEEDICESVNDLTMVENRTPKFAFDSDYGGTYEIPKHRTKEKTQTNNKKQQNRTDQGYQQLLSFKKLSFISEMSPLNAFLEVTQNDCGFFQCITENLTNEFIVLMIKVFAKLCDLPLDEYKKEFLQLFISNDSIFLKQLTSLINGAFENTIVKNKKSIFQINTTELIDEILIILKNVEINCLKSDAIKIFAQNTIDKLTKAGGKFSPAKVRLTEILKNLNEPATKLDITKEIYPTLDELVTAGVECIKPNIINGKYDSIQHYLKVHLTLLREDFISPLRDIIHEIKSSKNFEDLSTTKIYKKVRFLLNDVVNTKTRKGEMILVDLKVDQRYGNSNFASSNSENNYVNPKKLMFGSLLCFSTDFHFNNLILAVVSNRDVDMILKGYIQVEIIKMFNVGKIFEQDFIMFESEVFFEPYHHVHHVLRSLDETSFPMCNFIVDVDKTHHLPDYLNHVRKSFYEYRKYSFNPVDYATYPSAKSMKLDLSQMEAYQHALSNKFSLIQGPPGTGKTHIGLKILTTLLMNVDLHVLIICYTNHALDQFLSGILHVTEDIVRIGNQSKHELLDKYNIKQMTESVNTDRRLKSCYFNVKNDYMRKFQEFEQFQKDFDGSEQSYEKILKIQNELRVISRKLDEIKQITEYNLIKSKRIVGMTTTAAARCNLLLQLLKTPIVIIEEAAEVLEPHIIASITKNTQHLILIGDHQQLRPTTSVYKLSEKYKMDISLFERMIKNSLNSVCLITQHRMRPEIADLIRPTIYYNLQDHDDVMKYNNINGMAKNLYMITHTVKEAKTNEESTKKNPYEVQFLCALANYLLMQDYEPKDIVLLTTYNGQMIQFLHEKKQYPALQKVKVTVVDNFQGEESKIVLLSLVRSNDENSIGYLAMKNRICVALSRAREGLYIIGNMDCLANSNKTWKHIHEQLKKHNSIGNSLPLRCERHDVTMEMTTQQDFELVKFGGCQKRCDFELPCGHLCGYMCHRSGFDHLSDCGCNK